MQPLKRQRSTKLVATFENGFAKDWFFAVGDFFRNQLDIFLTDRVDNIIGPDGKKHKVKKAVWTQGNLFAFEQGLIFYDSPKGYLIWEEALKHISFVCQIERATPDLPGQNGKKINGSVVFDLWSSNHEQTGLEYIGRHQKAQHAFVDYLKTGNL